MTNASSIPAITATAAASAATAAITYFATKQMYEKNHDVVPAVAAPSSVVAKPSDIPTEAVETKTVKGGEKEEDFEYELFEIDYSMHAEHREKLLQRFDNLPAEKKRTNAAIVLDGGKEVSKYDTDTCYAFRQESFFQYLFGVREPDFKGALDVDKRESLLFIPRLSEEWELWCGKRKPVDFFKDHYKVDACHYEDEMAKVLQARGITYLFRLEGKNLDSGLTTQNTCTFDGYDKFSINDTVLHPELVECRVIKSEKELELMRYINRISSKAHIEVMKTVRPKMMEYHAESTFLHACYSKGGARLHAYTCICGSGDNASVLHYGHAGAPNDKKLEDGDLMLNDMGAEYHCYASDITCSFPVNGKFTDDQRLIYEGVLRSHDAAMKAMKPGVDYSELHLLSHRVMTEYFLEKGLFQNGSVEELMKHEISSYFYPHGLGHFMGLDVHDVGGFPNGKEKFKQKTFCKLRCARVLEKGMVLTIEPGCYFIDAQLENLLADAEKSKFVNQDMLKRFRNTGGVRIESDIIVTETGFENMTQVPRTVEEVEACMSSRS